MAAATLLFRHITLAATRRRPPMYRPPMYFLSTAPPSSATTLLLQQLTTPTPQPETHTRQWADERPWLLLGFGTGGVRRTVPQLDDVRTVEAFAGTFNGAMATACSADGTGGRSRRYVGDADAVVAEDVWRLEISSSLLSQMCCDMECVSGGDN